MRNFLTSSALVMAGLCLTGCGNGAGTGSDQAQTADSGIAAPAQGATAPDVAPPTAGATAGQEQAESNHLQIAGAEAACAAGDFNQFLFLYAQSAAVRARYTAAEVETGAQGNSRRLSRDAYLAQGPSIGALDNSFYTGASVRAWEQAMANGRRAELENIVWVINTAPDNRRRVEWSRASFDGQAEEGPGRPTALVGDPGTLLFHPTQSCWELVGDYNPALPGSITLEEVQR